VSALTESGELPAGITFTDNGNGTAAFSGTPNESNGPVEGTYSITLTASQAVGSLPAATQAFTLNVDGGGEMVVAGTSSQSAVLSMGAYSVLLLSSGAAVQMGDTMVTIAGNTSIGIQGASGQPTTLTVGPYTTTAFAGTSASNANVVFAAYSSLALNGTSGHTAALTLGQYSATTFGGGSTTTFQPSSTLAMYGAMTVGDGSGDGGLTVAAGSGATFNGGVGLNGVTTLSGLMLKQGTGGRIAYRVGAPPTPAQNQTFDPTFVDVLDVSNSTFAATDYVWQLAPPAGGIATDLYCMFLTGSAATGTLVIKDATFGTQLMTIGSSNPGDAPFALKIMYAPGNGWTMTGKITSGFNRYLSSVP